MVANNPADILREIVGPLAAASGYEIDEASFTEAREYLDREITVIGLPFWRSETDACPAVLTGDAPHKWHPPTPALPGTCVNCHAIRGYHKETAQP